jgi:dihydroflavonol-4-reductase
MMELAWRGAAIWAALRGGPPAIDKVSAQSASLERNYDNAKIKAAIGIDFKPISQTVAEVCERLKK